jgi:hypothetical protein
MDIPILVHDADASAAVLARVKSVEEIFILGNPGKRKEMRNPMHPMVHKNDI